MSDVPPGSVVIGPEQMYSEMQALTKAVNKLTDTVDPALVEMRKDIEKVALDQVQAEKDHALVHADIRKDVTVLKTQAKAAWAALTVLLVALGVIAAYLPHP